MKHCSAMKRRRNQKTYDWSFWRRNQHNLPKFFEGAQQIAIIQPSSATVERLFSYLRQAFDCHQESALEDVKETTVLLRYNENMRKKCV